MIKNIIFDVGGVIVKGHPSDILESINIDKELKEEVINKFFSNWSDLDLGLVTLKEKFNKCNFSFDINDELKNILINCFKYREFNEDILELIHTLKNNNYNYNVYILSNNNFDTVEYLRSLDFYKYIDGDCFSCFYHVVKPDEELYKILIDKYDLDISCSLFIDDNEKNIDMANELGFITKRYDSLDKNFINGLDDILN